MDNFSDDFKWGMRDCKEGVLAMVNGSNEYNKGYSQQYNAEQSLTEMGLMQEIEMEMIL